MKHLIDDDYCFEDWEDDDEFFRRRDKEADMEDYYGPGQLSVAEFICHNKFTKTELLCGFTLESLYDDYVDSCYNWFYCCEPLGLKEFTEELRNVKFAN